MLEMTPARGSRGISNRCLLLGLVVVCLGAGLTYMREVLSLSSIFPFTEHSKPLDHGGAT